MNTQRLQRSRPVLVLVILPYHFHFRSTFAWSVEVASAQAMHHAINDLHQGFVDPRICKSACCSKASMATWGRERNFTEQQGIRCSYSSALSQTTASDTLRTFGSIGKGTSVRPDNGHPRGGGRISINVVGLPFRETVPPEGSSYPTLAWVIMARCRSKATVATRIYCPAAWFTSSATVQ